MNYPQLKEEIERYEPTMTAGERRVAYAKGEEVDHIPISLPFGETLGHLYGYSVKQYNTTFESRVAEIEFLKQHPEFGGGTTGNVVMPFRSYTTRTFMLLRFHGLVKQYQPPGLPRWH